MEQKKKKHDSEHAPPPGIRSYLRTDFRHDVLAGIIVGLVALPLAIAFAVASGAKPEQGIYTAIIAGGLIALFSGSKFQVSGPTGAFVVILLGVVNKFGIESLLIAGFMAGLFLILMGVFRFGSIIEYIPYPVIVGFTAGIGTIIFFGQIKDFFGLAFSHRPHDFLETLTMIAAHFPKGVNGYAVIIGLTTLITYVAWKKINARFPPAPVALLAGTVMGLFFSGKIQTIGTIPQNLPELHMLAFSWNAIIILLPSALTIALLGAIESLLSAVVADGITGTKHNSNKELIAQGIGNVIVPFFGGIPATGAIARTATNIKNGARTRMAAFIHAVVLLLIIVLFAPFAQYIPLAALAAILMMVAYTMSEPHQFVKLFKAPRSDILVLMSTFLLTVFVDLTVAVGAGVVLAALLFIREVSEMGIHSLEDNQKNGESTTHELQASIQEYPSLSLYELSGPMFFGAASHLQEIIDHRPGEILILRMKHVPVIDATAIHSLGVIIDKVHKNKGKIILAALHPKVHRALKEQGLVSQLGGADFITATSREAIQKAKEILASQQKK